MKISGLFRTGALSLLIFGQLAVPKLAYSQKEQPAASKPLLKSEKDASLKTSPPKPSGKEAAVKPEAEKKSVVTDKKIEAEKPPAKANAAVKPEAEKKSSTTEKKAEAEKPSGKNSAGKQEVKGAATDTASSSSEAKKKQAHEGKTHSNASGGLIPPPPAFQPSYLIGPGTGIDGSFQPEFMTKEMALQRLKDVDKQVADAKKELEDKTAKVNEMKDRSERFASLYTEGVVSRHEFEAAGKEAEEAQKELEQFKANVAELESEKKVLNDRLKPAAKKNLQASKSPSNHKRRAAGSRS
jgi:hypothetical protein